MDRYRFLVGRRWERDEDSERSSGRSGRESSGGRCRRGLSSTPEEVQIAANHLMACSTGWGIHRGVLGDLWRNGR